MQSSRMAMIAATMFLVTACAGDYQKAADAFHSAASGTAGTIKDSNDSVSRLALEVRREAAVAMPAKISVRAGDCKTEATTGCRLDFERERGTKELLIAEQAPLVNTLRLARAIEAYAATLKAIADSDTASEVRTAVADADGALESLLKTASKGAEKKVEVTYAQPVAAAIGWVLGLYVKEAQLEALRAVTAAAEGPDPDNGPMARAVAAFKEAIGKAEQALRPRLAQAVTKAEDNFKQNPSEKGFDRLVDAAQSYDKLIRSKANEAPAHLRDAHRSLRAALRADRPETLDDYFASIKQVEADLKDLKDVIEGLLTAGKTTTEASS